MGKNSTKRVLKNNNLVTYSFYHIWWHKINFVFYKMPITSAGVKSASVAIHRKFTAEPTETEFWRSDGLSKYSGILLGSLTQ